VVEADEIAGRDALLLEKQPRALTVYRPA